MIPHKFAYLVGIIPFALVWIALYWHRKDVRKEMLFFGSLISILSFVTAYYWWTHDWWLPQTITGTRVGIEDLLLGFFTGGVAAVIYEEIFKKRYFIRKSHHHYPGIFTLGLLCALIISYLFWGVGLTSFYASSIAQIITAIIILYYRKDLFYNALASGILTAIISLPTYYLIIFVSPGWVDATYPFDTISGIRFTGIPIEELVFWFLFGFMIGPLYEYWKGEQLRKQKTAC